MEPYEIRHNERLRKLAPECIVLLKKDGSFPLRQSGPIAAYGNGVRHTVKGGTGSGDVNVRHFVTVEEGLQNAGFVLTSTVWLDAYDLLRQETEHAFQQSIRQRIEQEGLKAILLATL